MKIKIEKGITLYFQLMDKINQNIMNQIMERNQKSIRELKVNVYHNLNKIFIKRFNDKNDTIH